MTSTPEARIEAIGRANTGTGSGSTDAPGHAGGARERILREATRLFYDRGIRSAGVDLVIAEAGVAKASFYRHFPSKSVLVVAYLDRREAAWRAWLQEEIESRATSPRRRLVAIFDAIAAQIADPSFRGSAICNAVGEVGTELPEDVEQARHHRACLVEQIARTADAAGCRRPRDVAEECVLLMDGLLVAGRAAGVDGAAKAAATAAATAAAKRSIIRLLDATI